MAATFFRRIGTLVMFTLIYFVACASVCAGDGCPPSAFTYYFRFHGGDTIVEAAVFDTTVVNGDGDTTRVGFDHAAARLSLRAVGREWAGERVRERVDIAGVPPGTVVPITLTFSLLGEVFNNCGGGGCGAYFTATVASAADSSVANEDIPGPCDSCTKPVDTTLSLPVTITAGTPLDIAFAMLYHTTNVAWGRASVTGLYSVSGLPAGASAVFCAQSALTPARRATWGRLKAAYR
jgi:hypothetical protein